MTFSSFSFLYLLTIVTVVYWVLPHMSARKWWLIVASYAFYGWLTPWYCLLLATSTCVTLLCLRIIERTPARKKFAVLLSVAANIGMLAILKYWNFFADDVLLTAAYLGAPEDSAVVKIGLPIGLSFYTLQAIGITVDAYRGKVGAVAKIDTVLFLCFFPKLVAGPFEKATTFLAEIAEKKSPSISLFYEAAGLLLFGYMKKIVVAENVKIYTDQIFSLHDASPILLVVGAIGFAIQILADFSGYTDIARGSAMLLGIRLMENFQHPYLALTPSDFWRRWHISLSQWFRDYVYFPIGGSRLPHEWQICLVLIATMSVSGIWHGATSNFLLWGFYYGILLCIYRCLGLDTRWQPRNIFTRVIAWAIMTTLTLFGWLIFRVQDMQWLLHGITADPDITLMTIGAACAWLTTIFFFTIPWLIVTLCKIDTKHTLRSSLSFAVIIGSIIALSSEELTDFIYFKF